LSAIEIRTMHTLLLALEFTAFFVALPLLIYLRRLPYLPSRILF